VYEVKANATAQKKDALIYLITNTAWQRKGYPKRGGFNLFLKLGGSEKKELARAALVSSTR